MRAAAIGAELCPLSGVQQQMWGQASQAQPLSGASASFSSSLLVLPGFLRSAKGGQGGSSRGRGHFSRCWGHAGGVRAAPVGGEEGDRSALSSPCHLVAGRAGAVLRAPAWRLCQLPAQLTRPLASVAARRAYWAREAH